MATKKPAKKAAKKTAKVTKKPLKAKLPTSKNLPKKLKKGDTVSVPKTEKTPGPVKEILSKLDEARLREEDLDDIEYDDNEEFDAPFENDEFDYEEPVFEEEDAINGAAESQDANDYK